MCPGRDIAHLTHGQVIERLVANRLTVPVPLWRVDDWAFAVAALDGALALVAPQYLGGVGLFGGEGGQQRVPAVDGGFGLEDVQGALTA
ncbi:hypothetical protein [Streptomyces sp. NPDC101455]|uniref:hypothetical protein n=1 Tax=Streptomyces sp. NPDC101455 TaxID=3366142 RepID=UPI00382FBB56